MGDQILVKIHTEKELKIILGIREALLILILKEYVLRVEVLLN